MEDLYKFPTKVPEVPGSLLDVTIRRSMIDVLDHMQGRTYKPRNLPPAATWELFASTKGLLTKESLLELLAEKKAKTEAHDFSRHLRSETKVRSQAFETLRLNAIKLIRTREVANSKVIAGWAYAQMCAAVLAVLRNASPKQLAIVRAAIDQRDPSLDLVVSAVHDELQAIAAKQTMKSAERLEKGYGDARIDVFLHFSAFGLLATMSRPEAPQDAQRVILEGLYPHLDDFGDPLE